MIIYFTYKIETIYLTTRLNHGYCQYIDLQSTNEGFTIFTETYNKISTYKNFKKINITKT